MSVQLVTGPGEVGDCHRPQAITVADVRAGSASRPLALRDRPRGDSRTQMRFPGMKWAGGNGDVAGGQKAPLGVPVIRVKRRLAPFAKRRLLFRLRFRTCLFQGRDGPFRFVIWRDKGMSATPASCGARHSVGGFHRSGWAV